MLGLKILQHYFVDSFSPMMSDEVTYATLMLQDSARVGSHQDGNNLRKEGKISEKADYNRGNGSCYVFLDVGFDTIMEGRACNIIPQIETNNP